MRAGLREREGSDREAEAPGFDAAHLEEVADQLGHPIRDPAATLQELALHPGVRDAAVEEQIQVAAQAGQRRPQLVRHHRHEPGPFCVAGAKLRSLAVVGRSGRCDRQGNQDVAEGGRGESLRDRCDVDTGRQLHAEVDIVQPHDRDQDVGPSR